MIKSGDILICKDSATFILKIFTRDFSAIKCRVDRSYGLVRRYRCECYIIACLNSSEGGIFTITWASPSHVKCIRETESTETVLLSKNIGNDSRRE
ncbi:hypothetical protein BHU09_05810 [Tannerella sp. oral taxon 808]|nr:hypothetical protein BHU09_05810 [Tannerella sp. oral taxon 808]